MPIDDLVLASTDNNLDNECAIDIDDTIELKSSTSLTSTDDENNNTNHSNHRVSAGNAIDHNVNP